MTIQSTLVISNLEGTDQKVRDSESFKSQKQIMKRSGLITQQAQDIVSTSNDLYLLRKKAN